MTDCRSVGWMDGGVYNITTAFFKSVGIIISRRMLTVSLHNTSHTHYTKFQNPRKSSY